MSVNSFEHYVLTWKPDQKRLKAPLYLALARQLEHDIAAGTLPSGTKLPPQRELADYLDVSLSTITRTYTLCVKRGLLHAVTGKGTFVSEAANTRRSVIHPENSTPEMIDLSVAAPVRTDEKPVIQLIKRVLDGPDLSILFQYTYPFGTEKQRGAAIQWLRQFGIEAAEDRVLIANGTQNALNMTLSALFHDGDKIAVDQYTYANFIGLANMLNITLVPVKSDGDGMSAAELSRLLRTTAVKGIYLAPSCSNPQAVCMPMERRRQLAAIINEQDLILIEDDCYAFLLEEKLPPIATLVPDQSVYLSGMNKAVAPGLRIAFMWYSERYQERLKAAVYNCNLLVSPLNAEFACEIIQSGLYLASVRKQREQVLLRSAVYENHFPLVNRYSYYQWLPLPAGVSGHLFESIARKEGIWVYGSERFLVGDSDGKHYLRISTTAAKTERDLEAALEKIQSLFRELGRPKGASAYTL